MTAETKDDLTKALIWIISMIVGGYAGWVAHGNTDREQMRNELIAEALDARAKVEARAEGKGSPRS